MAKLKLRGKELIKLGYPEGKVVGIAINAILKHRKRSTKPEVLKTLQEVLRNPELYLEDEELSPIAKALTQEPKVKKEIQLNENAKDYQVFGANGIEDGAINQMDIAMQLPIVAAGALMPDAHQGYGLPIGGVLATENAVIPYGVGMDIGCRMCLTIYEAKDEFVDKKRAKLKEMLMVNTRFGKEAFAKPMDNEVLERQEFKEIKFIKDLKHKAYRQIGTSGSGNHFVEFGRVEITEERNEFDLPIGHYLGILSHSGSRGFGASIAKHYTQIAMEKCLLPKYAKHLAWLDLDSESGQEYWIAMNLAGDYASACHHQIHERLSNDLGREPLCMIENHHNFAWEERLPNGKKVIVHRKGATPAGKGVLGIIPGSMTAPAFIVRGKGNTSALNSASHGAGRLMSRRKAIQSFSFSELKKHLKKHQVDLIGAGMDEAPFAYKDIHEVMRHQNNLVDVLGKFTPKVVRMDQ